MEKNCTNVMYEAITAHSTDMSSIINSDGIYSFVGDSVYTWLGYSPAELIGTCAFTYIHSEDVQNAPFSLSQIEEQVLLKLRFSDSKQKMDHTNGSNAM